METSVIVLVLSATLLHHLNMLAIQCVTAMRTRLPVLPRIGNTETLIMFSHPTRSTNLAIY